MPCGVVAGGLAGMVAARDLARAGWSTSLGREYVPFGREHVEDLVLNPTATHSRLLWSP